MCRLFLHHGPYLRIVMLSRQQLQRRAFAGVRGTLLLLMMLSVMTISNGGTRTTMLAFSITSYSPWQLPLTHKSQYRSLPASSSSLSSSTAIETDGVPTSTTSTIVPSLQSYFIERNVTIRSVHWCNSNCDDHNSNTKNWNSEASTLLQIYRGASIPPIVPNATTIMEQRMGEPSHTTNDRIPYTNDHHRNDATASNVTSFETRIAKSMKESAELRATQNTIANIQQRLKILYLDHHICVVNKPSGVLSVPGPRRNPSVLEALYYLLHPTTTTTTTTDHNNRDHEHHHHRHMDQMVVHRLDMDTSGVLVFALSKEALQQLHTDFRQRRVTKVYQALLCHHISQRNNHQGMITHNHEYEINVDLERDPDHPPFMRIAQPKPQQHSRDPNTTTPPPSKFLNEASKPSLTEMHIISHEYYRIQSPHPHPNHQHPPPPNDTAVFPVTRVQLIPRTGRTHQLRVHMAHVLHHPIVGDDIYGYGGACFQSPGHGDDLVQRSLAEWGVPLCLHAQKLYIRHPISGAPMIFECEPHF